VEEERARFRHHQEAHRSPQTPSDRDLPAPFTYSTWEPLAPSYEAPPTALPDPPSTIDPGGGSSGGGGASGDL
jgi:hypothetical protein